MFYCHVSTWEEDGLTKEKLYSEYGLLGRLQPFVRHFILSHSILVTLHTPPIKSISVAYDVLRLSVIC